MTDNNHVPNDITSEVKTALSTGVPNSPRSIGDLRNHESASDEVKANNLNIIDHGKVRGMVIGMVTKVIAPGYTFFISVVYVKFLLNTQTSSEFVFVLSPLLLYLMVATLYLERESRLIMANWFRNKGIIIKFAETTFKQYIFSLESLMLMLMFIYYSVYIWYYSHSSLVGASTYLLVLTPIGTWYLLGYEYCDLNSKTEPISKVYENNLTVSFPGEIENFACDIYEFNSTDAEYQRLAKLKKKKWTNDDFELWKKVQIRKNLKFDSYQFGVKKPDTIKVYRKMGLTMIGDDYLTSKDETLVVYNGVVKKMFTIVMIACLITEVYGLTREYDACR